MSSEAGDLGGAGGGVWDQYSGEMVFTCQIKHFVLLACTALNIIFSMHLGVYCVCT